MKLKNVLVVVKDIEKSREFYHDLFGLDTILNHGKYSFNRRSGASGRKNLERLCGKRNCAKEQFL